MRKHTHQILLVALRKRLHETKAGNKQHEIHVCKLAYRGLHDVIELKSIVAQFVLLITIIAKCEYIIQILSRPIDKHRAYVCV